MSPAKRRKLIRFAAFIFLFSVSCLAFGYQEELKFSVKTILESRCSIALVSIYVVVSVSMHQICIGNNSDFSGIIHAHFGKYTDFIFAIITYVPASATSITLLKGLFMQLAFGQTYFSGFDTIDLASIFIVSSFLLYYSLFNSTKLLIAAISSADAVTIATNAT